ncbi:MAG: hypothetical protein H7Y12_11670 [Sphingobacteriaceae bacterium]|nr:hypothetical protein [Cytophagaceae bacterium]
MKTRIQFLLGAGLVLTSPLALAQQRADYAGIWLNTASYTQSVSRLDVGSIDSQGFSLVAWEGLPANTARRSMGRMAYQAAPNGTVSRLVVRLRTADVTELYYLDLQPGGTLWVMHHVSQAGTVTHCDTMYFARWLHPGLVGSRSQRRAAERPSAPPEVALRFTEVGASKGEPIPMLMAHTPRRN